MSPITTRDVNTLELVQAYIGYKLPEIMGPGTTVAVKGGRFTLDLGSRRLVTSSDYRNTTNGYTGIRADLGLANGFSATLVYTLPQVRLPDSRRAIANNRIQFDRESFDLVLWGGLASKRFATKDEIVELFYYHLSERDTLATKTRDRSLHSAGLRVYRPLASGRMDYEIELIRQFGSISASPAPGAEKLDVSAWFGHFEAGYSFRHRWSTRASLEFDYASGDRRGTKFSRFDSLYGMRRSELGPSGLYSSVGRTNLISPAFRLEAMPNSRFEVFAAYRPLWLASRFDGFSTTGVRDEAGRSGRFAGHQVEGRVRYWLIPKRLRLEWNGLFLAKGHFLRNAPNAPAGGDTLYNSFNATVSF